MVMRRLVLYATSWESSICILDPSPFRLFFYDHLNEVGKDIGLKHVVTLLDRPTLVKLLFHLYARRRHLIYYVAS